MLSAMKAAHDYGFSYRILVGICKEHPGFALVISRRFFVPAEHMELLVSCRLTPAEIAARARGEAAAA